MLCYYYYVFVDANTYILLLLTPFWLKMRASNFPNNNSVPNNVFTYLIFQRTQKMHLQAGPYYIAFCCFGFNNHMCIEGCISSQNFVDVHIHTDFSKKLSCTHGRALQCEICCLVPIHTLNSESKSYLMAEFQKPESSWADNHGQRFEGTPKRGEQWSGAPLCWLIMGSCSEERAILYHHKVNVSKPERWRGSAFGFLIWQRVKGIQMDRMLRG